MINATPIQDPVITKNAAIKAAGSPAKLSRILGISRASVSSWGDVIPTFQAYRLIKVFPELDQ